jgi:hypothetical protein
MRSIAETDKDLYRLVLLHEGSVLAFDDVFGLRIPLVEIAAGLRPAEQIQNVVAERWRSQAIVLAICHKAIDVMSTAIVEMRSNGSWEGMALVALSEIDEAELAGSPRRLAATILSGLRTPDHPFFRMNWIEEGQAWLRNKTGLDDSFAMTIRQLNASGNFALVRFVLESGKTFWMKATGEPNRHEFSVTQTLAQICPDFLPTIIASRLDWNAWLMEDAGTSPSEWSQHSLKQAVCSMARMQIQTFGRTEELLNAGVGDLRVAVLRQGIPQLIGYLKEAMKRQSSIKASRIEEARLTEIGNIVSDCCFQMEALNIPDTLVHNDINSGNILFEGGRCVFTDWAEAAVGNPFVTFQHMTLLQPIGGSPWIPGIRRAYKRRWTAHLESSVIDQAFVLVPALAILAYLYGRGSWLVSPRRYEPGFESYARALARHLDRAVRNPNLQEVLCH